MTTRMVSALFIAAYLLLFAVVMGFVVILEFCDLAAAKLNALLD